MVERQGSRREYAAALSECQDGFKAGGCSSGTGRPCILKNESLSQDPRWKTIRPLDDPWTHFAITAERAMLAELGGGCQVPIGAYATLENTELFLTGGVFSPDGSVMIRYTATGDCTRAAELGRNVAKVLLQRGAGSILESVYE